MKKLISSLLLTFALAVSAKAQLTLTLNSHIVDGAALGLSAGDAITSTYIFSGAPDVSGSSLVWNTTQSWVKSGSTTLFMSDLTSASFSTIDGASGFQALGFSSDAILVEALLSSSTSVMQDGLVKDGLEIWNFDASASGLLVTNAGTAEWAIDSYAFSITPSAVPEPSTYGLIGAVVLCGAITLRRRNRRAALARANA